MALAKSDRGAGFVGSVIVLVLSLVGGSFVPAEQFPPFLRSLAMLVPNGAAQQGFIDILVHHAPLSGPGRPPGDCLGLGPGGHGPGGVLRAAAPEESDAKRRW